MKKKPVAKSNMTSKSKTPIEDTIRKRWPAVLAGASNGQSRATIRRDLEDEQEYVGSASGFNAALNRVAQLEGVDLRLLFSRTGRGVAAASPDKSPDPSEGVVISGDHQSPLAATGQQNPELPGVSEGAGQSPARQEDDPKDTQVSRLSRFVDDRFSSNF